MSGAAVQTEPTKTRIHMMRNYPDLLKEPGRFPNVEDFLDKKFPDDKPPKTSRFQRCEVDLGQGIKIPVTALGNHVFIGQSNMGGHYGNDEWHLWGRDYGHVPDKTVEPFVTIEVLKAETRAIQTEKLSPRKVRLPFGEKEKGEPKVVLHGYIRTAPFDGRYGGHRYTNRDNYREATGRYTPFIYLTIRVTTQDGTSVEGEFLTKQPDVGVATLAPTNDIITIKSEFYGVKDEWEEHLGPHTMRLTSGNYRGHDTLNSEPLSVLYRHLTGSELPDGKDAWWERFFDSNAVVPTDEKLDMKGLAAVLKQKKIKPSIDQLRVAAPTDWRFFKWLSGGKTVNKRSNNSLLAAMLRAIGDDFYKLTEALQHARNVIAPTTPAFDGYHHDIDKHGRFFESRRAICLELPGAKEKVQEQDAKADWAKAKSNGKQADALGIDKAKYPKLRKAVEAGEIPTNVFRQPDKNPVNREFAIWEKALKRKGWAEVIYEIAVNASGRSTYEKDITPYLAFLFRIEKYLKKHSKRKWTAMPKFVQSQWELEMDEADDGGTTKRRSAFTPVADNETGIVTVPYVAVSVSGVRTQWCYARHYHLFEEGFTDPESGGIVVNELEIKLNGRDDYGLCYYTLTGTETARGYPTFLIIFERLAAGTRVHFHRVRPQRSKNGRKTPGCELIEACYQYMAGNIPASDVSAQQGDLIFIKHPHDPVEKGAKVKEPQESMSIEFESHRFSPLGVGGPMKLYESEAKTPKNRLGFLYAPTGLSVSHPEHDDIAGLVEGWWEIRRCRSWEANPHAIWSLTID